MKKQGNNKENSLLLLWQIWHKPNSDDDKIYLQTSACDKIANTEFTLPLTSQIDVIIEPVFYILYSIQVDNWVSGR